MIGIDKLTGEPRTLAVQVVHEAHNPFPFADRKGNRAIVDEICTCGHLRSEHQDRFAYGHGACRCQTPIATGVHCSCRQFTWSAFVFDKPEPAPAPRKKARRTHSRDGRVRCDICSPLRCTKAPR